MTIKSANDRTIKEAATLLQSGECVVIPTETVYGLAANALNKQAVEKIFAIKKRPNFNPLISHFNNLDQLTDYIDLTNDAKKLASVFWPGAMTLIVNRKDDCKINNIVTAGLNTIAVRIPSHPTAQKIIKECGFPLAAPSANKSGEISPTCATHVATSLGSNAPLIIADGSSKIGLESTVIDVTNAHAIILRPGAITSDQCSDVLGYEVKIDTVNHKKPKSPGQVLKHYAPKAKVRLKSFDVEADEALLAFGSTKFMPTDKLKEEHFLNLSETSDLEEAASNLFSYMRRLDQTGVKNIAVMDIPNIGIGIAINDRLKRSAEK